MSSSEQAPEPTMDEILASIRKIIADDDEGSAEGSASAAEAVPEDAAEAGGQPGLADDIANVLNSDAAAADNEDDIFDLTNRVADSPADAQPDPYAGAYRDAQQPGEAAGAYAAPQPEMPPPPPAAGGFPQPPEPQPEPFSGEPAHSGAPEPDILSGAPMEESSLPETTAGFGAVEPQAPAESAWAAHGGDFQPAAETQPSGPETGEVADLDNFAPGQRLGTGGDNVDAAYAESDVVAGTPAPGPDSLQDMESGAPAPDPAMALPGQESPYEAPSFPDAGAVAAAEAQETAIAPPPPEPPLFEAPETETEDVAAEAGAGGPKSLEDSVKEMLRPMLRAWLDDNMPRIVESAVRDELHNKHNQF